MTLFDKLLRYVVILLACFLVKESYGQNISVTPSKEAEQIDGWYSYRKVYSSLLTFEKFSKPKHLIQLYFHVIDQNARVFHISKLRIDTKPASIAIPVDALGRFELPMIRQVFEANSELHFQVEGANYYIAPVLSIRLRSDHSYWRADMTKACEQITQFLFSIRDSRIENKRCVGIYWVSQSDESIPTVKGSLLNRTGQIQQNYLYPLNLKVFNLKFSEWNESIPLLSQASPLAIIPQFE